MVQVGIIQIRETNKKNRVKANGNRFDKVNTKVEAGNKTYF